MINPLAEPLTPRELRVLERLCAGRSNRELGEDLHVSEQTIKFHLKNIYGKLGVTSRTQAMLAMRSQHGAPAAFAGQGSAGLAELRRHMEPPLSPLDFLRRARQLHGPCEAVVDGSLRFSWSEFGSRVDTAAAVLGDLGIRHGDRVALIAPGGHEVLELFHAVPMLGAIIVPINLRLPPAEQAGLIQHCRARMVCASTDVVDALDAEPTNQCLRLQRLSLDGPRRGWLDYAAMTAEPREAPKGIPVADDDLIAINYTSGTTGTPRGAMISHRSIWMHSLRCLLHWPLDRHDRFLWLLPNAHANGWGFIWTLTAAAATHVCTRNPTLADNFSLIARERITALGASRTVLQALAQLTCAAPVEVPRGVRVLTAGSAPTAALIARIERDLGWCVTQGYGLTETSVFIAFSDRRSPLADTDNLNVRARYVASQNTATMVGCEIRVVDEEGIEVPADASSIGEVVVRSGTLMRGYWRDPEATARAFANGWFHTGDAAVVHPDGTFEIRDRIKDIIISDDQLVPSLEVEAILVQHAEVLEAAVVGVPDEALGERIVAWIVPRNPASFSVESLSTFLAHRLAPFKCPHRIEVARSLPRTATGKMRKQLLRAQAQDFLTAAVPAGTGSHDANAHLKVPESET